jgi:hypothetical protein
MLSKISQTQKDKYFLPYEESRIFFKKDINIKGQLLEGTTGRGREKERMMGG